MNEPLVIITVNAKGLIPNIRPSASHRYKFLTIPPPVTTPTSTPITDNKLMIPDHSLYFAYREWSGIDISNLSAKSNLLLIRIRG